MHNVSQITKPLYWGFITKNKKTRVEREMIFPWILNASICNHITVKYKFTNLPHHQKGQVHFSGHHLAGFHQSTPRNKNHFQFPRHTHIRLHIFMLLISHVYLLAICLEKYHGQQNFSWIEEIKLQRS